MGKTYKAPVVGKAFAVLDVLARRDEGARTQRGWSPPPDWKEHRLGILSAAGGGAVERDPTTRRYVLGSALRLGRADARLDLRTSLDPSSVDFMDKTRQSVFLGVRAGDHVTVLDVVESREDRSPRPRKAAAAPPARPKRLACPRPALALVRLGTAALHAAVGHRAR